MHVRFDPVTRGPGPMVDLCVDWETAQFQQSSWAYMCDAMWRVWFQGSLRSHILTVCGGSWSTNLARSTPFPYGSMLHAEGVSYQVVADGNNSKFSGHDRLQSWSLIC